MPVFGGAAKKTPNDHHQQSSNSTPPRESPTVSSPPLPSQSSHWSDAPPAHSVLPSRRELVFHCQLAHGSATKEIKDFSNVKELYGRIANAFDIAVSEIVYCTLNTHKADMSRLLGGQIGLEDFIFVHIKGQTKEVTLNKTEPSLGLTITDNGAGVAFVKRLREGSIADRNPLISVGDMIHSINGKKMIGCRHYEVAKILKETPVSTEIVLKLSETRKAFELIAPRGASNKGGVTVPVMDGDTGQLEELVSKGEGRATLRMKKNGHAVIEEVKPWEGRAASRVDDLLETFLGIRDLDLSQTIVDISKQSSNLQHFSEIMNDEFRDFEFPLDFVADIWSSITRAKETLSNN